MTYLAIFGMVAVADALWARYIRATAERRAMVAACYASGLILSSGVLTVSLIESPWYLVPACLGAFTGTWVAARG